MAVAVEIQAGGAVINGIKGTIVMSTAAPSVAAYSGNISSRTLTDNFKLDKLADQSGVTTETFVATMRERTLDLDFIPSSTSHALVIAEILELTGLGPLDVVTIAQSGAGLYAPAVAACAGTWNLMEGMQIKEVREGMLSVSMKLMAPQKLSDGSFAALALVV